MANADALSPKVATTSTICENKQKLKPLHAVQLSVGVLTPDTYHPCLICVAHFAQRLPATSVSCSAAVRPGLNASARMSHLEVFCLRKFVRATRAISSKPNRTEKHECVQSIEKINKKTWRREIAPPQNTTRTYSKPVAWPWVIHSAPRNIGGHFRRVGPQPVDPRTFGKPGLQKSSRLIKGFRAVPTFP